MKSFKTFPVSEVVPFFLMLECLVLMLLRIDLNLSYRQHQCAKRRAYEERVRGIEHAYFSPLVFSTSGGMDPSTTVTYKHLAFLRGRPLIAELWAGYAVVLAFLFCTLPSCALGVLVPPLVTPLGVTFQLPLFCRWTPSFFYYLVVQQVLSCCGWYARAVHLAVFQHAIKYITHGIVFYTSHWVC